MKQELSHECPDGETYKWVSRKDKPVKCPRCATRLEPVGRGK